MESPAASSRDGSPGTNSARNYGREHSPQSPSLPSLHSPPPPLSFPNSAKSKVPKRPKTPSAAKTIAPRKRNHPASVDASGAAPAPVTKRACTTRAISTFTNTMEVAAAFRLDHALFGPEYTFELGKPNNLSQLELPQTYKCLMRMITSHTANFDRSSEAICRTPVDLMLNECLIILKGQQFNPEYGQLLPSITTPLNTYANMVAVNGEIEMFWHDPLTFISYSGRVDYGVGIASKTAILARNLPHPTQHAKRSPYPYTALLLCVEAKRQGDVDTATAQLAAYMAIIHRHRLARGNPGVIKTSVYGIATDGLTYDFLEITSESRLRQARRIKLTDTADVASLVEGVLWILESELEGKVEDVVRSRPASRVVSGNSSATGGMGSGMGGVAEPPDVGQDVNVRYKQAPTGRAEDLLQELLAEGVMDDGEALDLANSGYNALPTPRDEAIDSDVDAV